jgi:S1-C subfamily serine protease
MGNVTATAGPEDNPRLLQISAPIQPGNSGGPLMDERGNIVGVVVAQLRPGIAQNVNFAIKASVALSPFYSP